LSCTKIAIFILLFNLQKCNVRNEGEIDSIMIKRLLLILSLGISLSGCFMAPLALIGPATSGFSTASIIQSGLSSGASYVVKKNTGKSITEHAIYSINKSNDDALQQTFLPKEVK